MKRNPDGTIDMSALDPHVASVYEDGQRRQAARSMSKRQRQQAARNRMTFDIPVELEDKLTAIALDYSVPVSQLATFLMLRGLEHTSEEELLAARVPSRSMRYEFVLYPKEATPRDTTKRRH
jgi:hypothetical protein